MNTKQLNRKIAEIQEMPTHEVLRLRDRVSISDGNIVTKDKLMEAIAIRLSDNAKASMSLLESWELEDEI